MSTLPAQHLLPPTLLDRLDERGRHELAFAAHTLELLAHASLGTDLDDDGMCLLTVPAAQLRVALDWSLGRIGGVPMEEAVADFHRTIADTVPSAEHVDAVDAGLRTLAAAVQSYDAALLRQLGGRAHRLGSGGGEHRDDLITFDVAFVLLIEACYSDVELNEAWVTSVTELGSAAIARASHRLATRPDDLFLPAVGATVDPLPDAMPLVLDPVHLVIAANLAFPDEVDFARALLERGLREAPDDPDLLDAWARIGPPRVRAVAPRPDRAAYRQFVAWRATHGQRHAGQWVAVRDGALVAADASLEQVQRAAPRDAHTVHAWMGGRATT